MTVSEDATPASSRPAPPLPTVCHSVRALFVLCFHPIRSGNYFGSLMLLPSAFSVCGERFSGQVERSNHKHTLALRDINDP